MTWSVSKIISERVKQEKHVKFQINLLWWLNEPFPVSFSILFAGSFPGGKGYLASPLK